MSFCPTLTTEIFRVALLDLEKSFEGEGGDRGAGEKWETGNTGVTGKKGDTGDKGLTG